MKSARKQLIPKQPNTLKELGNALARFDKYHNFYRGEVSSKDGKSALIFLSDTMKNALNEAKHLLGDGTFRVSILFKNTH